MAYSFQNTQLIRARKAAGLSQAQLAKHLGKSSSVVSQYETGHSVPAPDTALLLAESLRRPLGFFFSEMPDRDFSRVLHRRNRSCSKRSLDMLHFQVQDYLEIVRSLEIIGALPPVSPYLRAARAHDLEPEQLAERVRVDLRLGPGPLGNVVRLVESLGVLVVDIPMKDVDYGGVSALSVWEENRPVVFLLHHEKSHTRKRFTVSHELAHLLAHRGQEPSEELEQFADAFAGNFLMPAFWRAQVPRTPSLSYLLALKREWHVSMKAMVMQARKHNLLSDAVARRLYIELAKKGLPEPGEPGAAEPAMAFVQAILKHRDAVELHLHGIGLGIEFVDDLIDHNTKPHPLVSPRSAMR